MPRYTPGRMENGRWVQEMPPIWHKPHKEHLMGGLCELVIELEKQEEKPNINSLSKTFIFQELTKVFAEYGFSYFRNAAKKYAMKNGEGYSELTKEAARVLFKKGFSDYKPNQKDFNVTEAIIHQQE